jgi:hypothetical protein
MRAVMFNELRVHKRDVRVGEIPGPLPLPGIF